MPYLTNTGRYRIENLWREGKSPAGFSKPPLELAGTESYQDRRPIAVDSRDALYFVPPNETVPTSGVRKLSRTGHTLSRSSGFTPNKYVLPSTIALDPADNISASDGTEGVVELSASGDLLVHLELHNLSGNAGGAIPR